MTSAEMMLSGIVALVGGGHVWNWLASRGKAKVDLIQLGQTISAEIITALKAERDELSRKVEALEGRIGELQDDVRDLTQHVGSLETQLREKGVEPPPRPSRRRVAA